MTGWVVVYRDGLLWHGVGPLSGRTAERVVDEARRATDGAHVVELASLKDFRRFYSEHDRTVGKDA